MKILLAAVNAKYIHSNLAVYCLRAYAKEQHPASNITISEYTINQPFDEILMDIYKQAPDVLCLSCYLWNVTEVGQLIQEIPKILPDTKIWLGGKTDCCDTVSTDHGSEQSTVCLWGY